jgi:glycosyltransferase involved in cell wall biosynthesis
MVTISVVIASKVGSPFLDNALASIKDEAEALDAEVIVVAADAQHASAVAQTFPWVQVVHSPETPQVPALRRRGVEEAKGNLVAIIEEHCYAAPSWLQHAIAAHARGEYGAVGGPVADDNYSRLADWVVYFCEYNSDMPPTQSGETQQLNDANIVYRRQFLLDHLHLLDDGYWPMSLHPVALAAGTKFLAVPEMVVHHRGPFDFGYYLHQRYLFSRAYAGVRAQTQPTSRRVAYLLGAPLVPFMLLGRMSLRVWRKGHRVGQFVRALPLTIPALFVLVAGEWVGCLLGPGNALAKVE